MGVVLVTWWVWCLVMIGITGVDVFCSSVVWLMFLVWFGALMLFTGFDWFRGLCLNL